MADVIPVDTGKIQAWLFSRAGLHQDRGEWDASFEDLYLVTAIFRGDFAPDPDHSSNDCESIALIESK